MSSAMPRPANSAGEFSGTNALNFVWNYLTRLTMSSCPLEREETGLQQKATTWPYLGPTTLVSQTRP